MTQSTWIHDEGPNTPDGTFRTWTGRLILPLALKHEDIDLEDIAHALSNKCRFNGHCRFLSVAQHSVLVAKKLPSNLQLWGLLHDASEAYLDDIIKPLKELPEFAFYKKAERDAMRVICERFDLPIEEPEAVKIADYRMYLTERREMRPNGPPCMLQDESYPDPIDPWMPAQAYDNFISALLPHVEPEELPKWAFRFPGKGKKK